MARAINSLPVPLSPWMSTVLRRLATSAVSSRIAQLGNIDGPGNTVKGVVLLDMDEVMLGIEAVNDLTCERLASENGHKLQAIEYKVVGHAEDGNTLFVEVTADASELLVPEDDLTEEC